MSTYPIHPDVRRIAKRFGVDAALIQAVVKAEGGTLAHLLKAVRCSLPNTKDTTEAIEITCRTVAHRLSDYVRLLDAPGFVEFLGAKWAPIGVENDPKHLNQNWVPNVRKAWLG